MAAALTSSVWILAVSMVISGVRGEDTEVYNLQDRCGQTIDLERKHLHEAVIIWNEIDSYSANQDCIMTMHAAQGTKIMFKLLDIEFKNCGAWLGLYETTTANIIDDNLCTMETDTKLSQTNVGIIRFRSGSQADSGGFKLLVTPYYDTVGECRDDYFKCANGRCVHEDVKCNGMDNCGDDSDDSDNDKCKREKKQWPWWGYLLLGVGIFLLCVVTCTVWNIIRFKANKKRSCKVNRCGGPCKTQNMSATHPAPSTNNMSATFTNYNMQPTNGQYSSPADYGIQPPPYENIHQAPGASAHQNKPFTYNNQDVPAPAVYTVQGYK